MLRLETPQFFLSDDEKTLHIVLTEAMPDDHPDPAMFVPEFERTIDLPLPKAPGRKNI